MCVHFILGIYDDLPCDKRREANIAVFLHIVSKWIQVFPAKQVHTAPDQFTVEAVRFEQIGQTMVVNEEPKLFTYSTKGVT